MILLCMIIIVIVNAVISFISRAVLKGKVTKNKAISGKIISFGQNYYLTNSIGKIYTIHAEHDAINKLPYTKKKMTINLLVVRFTKNNKLCMSKPCDQCINNIHNLAPKKGYIVKNIYYSTSEETIEKTSLTRLKQESNLSR
jgi:deoxycytidylate deaminase